MNDLLNSSEKSIKENNQNQIKNSNNNDLTYNPFEIVKGKSIEKDFDRIFLINLEKSLYNTPLTNKLYPKSNLYGHELIRYFDF